MKIILFLLMGLLSAFLSIANASPSGLLEGYSIQDIQVEKAIAPWIIWAIVSAVISVSVGVYSYLQARKMQKKQKQNSKPSQIDGSIADYGKRTSGFYGTTWTYGNNVDEFDPYTTEIKSGGGGKK